MSGSGGPSPQDADDLSVASHALTPLPASPASGDYSETVSLWGATEHFEDGESERWWENSQGSPGWYSNPESVGEISSECSVHVQGNGRSASSGNDVVSVSSSSSPCSDRRLVSEAQRNSEASAPTAQPLVVHSLSGPAVRVPSVRRCSRRWGKLRVCMQFLKQSVFIALCRVRRSTVWHAGCLLGCCRLGRSRVAGQAAGPHDTGSGVTASISWQSSATRAKETEASAS